MNIRLFQRSDLHNVISFLQDSPFTNWTEETWLKNKLTAILAFDKNKIVGAFPLQPRSLNIGNSEYIDVLWATSFYISDKYKQYGFGHFMWRKIKDTLQSQYKGIFNYNSPQDKTYDWYISLGNYSFAQIFSYKKDVTAERNTANFNYFGSYDDINQIKNKLYNCFKKNDRSFGGTTRRHKDFWNQHLNYCYHRNHYKYSMLTIDSQNSKDLDGYILLGETQIRDRVRRFDILEQSLNTSKIPIENLYKSLVSLAHKKKLQEIRIQSSSEDSFNKWIKELDFFKRWNFDILGQVFEPTLFFFSRVKKNVFFNKSFKITIISEKNIEKTLGSGKDEIKLFIPNFELNKLVLGRLDFVSAIDSGKIKIVKNNKSAMEFLSNIFIINKWKFHHIDYI